METVLPSRVRCAKLYHSDNPETGVTVLATICLSVTLFPTPVPSNGGTAGFDLDLESIDCITPIVEESPAQMPDNEVYAVFCSYEISPKGLLASFVDPGTTVPSSGLPSHTTVVCSRMREGTSGSVRRRPGVATLPPQNFRVFSLSNRHSVDLKNLFAVVMVMEKDEEPDLVSTPGGLAPRTPPFSHLAKRAMFENADDLGRIARQTSRSGKLDKQLVFKLWRERVRRTYAGLVHGNRNPDDIVGFALVEVRPEDITPEPVEFEASLADSTNFRLVLRARKRG